MIRRLLAIALGVGLLGTAVAGPPPARAGEPWTIGSSSGLVAATFTSGTSGTDTALALLNRTSIADRLKLGPDASFILEALGFGGGYSQEATWPAGSDPAIRCPPTGSNLACTSNSDGSGRVIIPGPVRASLLARSVGARGSTSLTVAPGYRSLLYDLAVTAIGIALGATCTTGLAGASADEVAALAVQLLPEAVGVAAALRRNDRRAAGTELVALSERAVAVITAHALGSAVGGGLCIAAQTIPGLLEVKLAIAALRAVPPLVLLSASLVTGTYGATVTVSYGGGAGATAAPSETAGPSTAGVLADIASIGGGESFTCALLGSGSVACWGIDMKAAAGGSRVPDTRPIVVGGPLVDAATMATGGGQTCVVRRDGSVACWGDDEHGMLGDGSAGVRPDPFTVPGVAGATSVIGGFWHSCAILGDRTVTCWGQIWDGGTGTMVDMATPTPVGGLTDVVSLSAGQNYTCALRGDGSVACWGNGQYGQLGDGATQARARPATVPGLSGAVAIAGEGDRVCVLLRDATVSCWGSFNDVQLDVRPVAISGLSNVTAIAGGQGFMCALLRDTTVTCWGSNGDGQLGDGTTQDRAQPVAVTGLSGVAAIGAGWYHACAILVDTTARCWGDNEFGQLGDGTTVNQAEPVPVLAPWDASIPTPTPSPTPSAGPVSAPAAALDCSTSTLASAAACRWVLGRP